MGYIEKLQVKVVELLEKLQKTIILQTLHLSLNIASSDWLTSLKIKKELIQLALKVKVTQSSQQLFYTRSWNYTKQTEKNDNQREFNPVKWNWWKLYESQDMDLHKINSCLRKKDYHCIDRNKQDLKKVCCYNFDLFDHSFLTCN